MIGEDDKYPAFLLHSRRELAQPGLGCPVQRQLRQLVARAQFAFAWGIPELEAERFVLLVGEVPVELVVALAVAACGGNGPTAPIDPEDPPVDTAGNRVLQPNETVVMEPAWQNTGRTCGDRIELSGPRHL